MRFCVVSDTHRHRHELLQVVKASQPLDAVIHAGDETSDVQWLAAKVDWPIYAVAGNWDRPTRQYPAEVLLRQYGPTILVTHGHTQGVKDGVQGLLGRALDCGADIVIFGHTHQAMSQVASGKLFINPGSLAQPRGRTERTYALLDITPLEQEHKCEVRVAHFTLQGESLADLIVTVHFLTTD